MGKKSDRHEKLQPNQALSQQSHMEIKQIRCLVFNDAETQDLWKIDCAKNSHILYETVNRYKIKKGTSYSPGGLVNVKLIIRK